MPDLFHLPAGAADRQQYYYPTGQPQVWVKPRGVIMTHWYLLEPGGGGGGGMTGATNTQRGGGGGGTNGAGAAFIVPAAFLPDVLYVDPAAGGAGGNASSPGSIPAGNTSVAVVANYGVATTLFRVTNTNGSPAGAGTVSVGGAGGTTAAVNTAAQLAKMPLGAMLGSPSLMMTSVAGQAGGASATPGNVSWPNGGGGGGGCTSGNVNSIGGGISSTAPFVTTALPGGAVAGGNGVDGFAMGIPLLFMPGTGGGSNGAGTGGNGGNGGLGCGGGGGGGGITGGAGGAGGGGLVVVTCW